MKFDLINVEMSKPDIRTGVRIPQFLTGELAEFIGIIIGDGHIGYRTGVNKKSRKYVQYVIKIAFDKREQQYIQHVTDLFYCLFKTKLSPADIRGNGLNLRKNSKGIVTFLHRVCEIPLNKKVDTVKIPQIILQSPNYIKRKFLKGLSDTDFSVAFKNKTILGHTYPVIKAKFKSKNLVQDLELVYKDLDFVYCTCYDLKVYDSRRGIYYTGHEIYLNGKQNLYRWIQTIGFSNQKFQLKVKKWKKDGVCPPYYQAPEEI